MSKTFSLNLKKDIDFGIKINYNVKHKKDEEVEYAKSNEIN